MEENGERGDAAGASARDSLAELVGQAEELVARPLSGLSDYSEAAAAFSDLIDRWRAEGPLRSAAQDRLWERFQAAVEMFRAATTEELRKEGASRAANLAEARELLAAAEALLPVSDVEAARTALHVLEIGWYAIGPVGDFEVYRAMADRFAGVQNAVREAARAERRRRAPSAAELGRELETRARRLLAQGRDGLGRARSGLAGHRFPARRRARR